MVTIGNADSALALIRSQLERMAKARRGTSTVRTFRKEVPGTTGVGRTQIIAGLRDLPDDNFARALIGVLLTEEFGEEVAADARFQSVIDQVADILRGDDGLAGLLSEVRRDLMAAK